MVLGLCPAPPSPGPAGPGPPPRPGREGPRALPRPLPGSSYATLQQFAWPEALQSYIFALQWTIVTIYHHFISQAGWNICNLSIYLSYPPYHFPAVASSSFILLSLTPSWTALICGSHHLLSQAGWNRCDLMFLNSLSSVFFCVATILRIDMCFTIADSCPNGACLPCSGFL